MLHLRYILEVSARIRSVQIYLFRVVGVQVLSFEERSTVPDHFLNLEPLSAIFVPLEIN